MPAKAGIQNHLKILDSRLRGNDAKGGFKTFYETINIERSILIALRFIYFTTSEPQNIEYRVEGWNRVDQSFLK